MSYSCGGASAPYSRSSTRRGQRGDGQPGAQQRPGVSESTREAVLTALDVLGYERPTKLGERARLVGPRPARAAEPDLPGARRGDGRRARPARLHPVLCTQTAGGVSEATTSTCCSAAGVRRRLRGRHLRRRRRPTTTTPGCASGGCPWCWSTRRSTWLDFPPCRATTRGWSRRSITSCARAPAHRPAPARGPRAPAAQARGRGSRPATASTPDRPGRALAVLDGGGQPRRTSCSTRCHRHRVRQRLHGARRDPGRARGAGSAYLETSRWSASTTRRS